MFYETNDSRKWGLGCGCHATGNRFQFLGRVDSCRHVCALDATGAVQDLRSAIKLETVGAACCDPLFHTAFA
jgi:hypothetical protein